MGLSRSNQFISCASSLIFQAEGRERFSRVDHVTNNFWGLRIRKVYVRDSAASRPDPRASQPIHLFPGSKRFPRSSRKAGSTHSHQPSTLRHDRQRPAMIQSPSTPGLHGGCFGRPARASSEIVNRSLTIICLLTKPNLRVAMRAKPRSSTAVQRRTTAT